MTTNYREWLNEEGTAAIAVYGGRQYVTLAIRDANGGSVQFVISDPDEADALVARVGRVMAAIRKHAEAMPEGGEQPAQVDAL